MTTAPLTRVVAPSDDFTIYIAGDLDVARQACRAHCLAIGLCVTVAPVDYVYTGGCESGVRVGLINYPRFPLNTSELAARAEALALALLDALCQQSCSIVGPVHTVWLTRRPQS